MLGVPTVPNQGCQQELTVRMISSVTVFSTLDEVSYHSLPAIRSTSRIRDAAIDRSFVSERRAGVLPGLLAAELDYLGDYHAIIDDPD